MHSNCKYFTLNEKNETNITSIPLGFNIIMNTKGTSSCLVIFTSCNLGLTSHFKDLAHLKLTKTYDTCSFKIIQLSGKHPTIKVKKGSLKVFCTCLKVLKYRSAVLLRNKNPLRHCCNSGFQDAGIF